MVERRKRIMKRLLMEELERRTMLDAGFPASFPAMASTGLTDNSYEDFYKAQVGTEIGGAAGVGMLNRSLTPAALGLFQSVPGIVPPMGSYYFDAANGVGQMLLTTGANTLGISSFVTPTAGPSRAGGTGSAAMGGVLSPQAADQALQELMSELPALVSSKIEGTEFKRAQRVAAADGAQANAAQEIEELFALVEAR